MVTKAKAVQFGCGLIGCSVVRYAWQRPDIELVGAVGIDKSLIGRDLGEVAGIKNKLGVSISADANAALSQARTDVVFLTTGSSLKDFYPQVEKYVAAGADVVLTCEELSYPYRKDFQLSAEIDKIAKANNVTVLAT